MKILRLLCTNPTIDLFITIEHKDFTIWNKKTKQYSIFLKACANGLVDIVDFIIQQQLYFEDNDNALSVACKHARIGVIKLLLLWNFPIGDALKSAILSRDMQVLELILSDSRVTISPEHISNTIVELGNLAAARRLLSDTRFQPQLQSMLENPEELSFYDIETKCTEWIEIVKMLLNDPTADTSKNENNVMKVVCYIGNRQVVEFLLSHPEVDPNTGLYYSTMYEKPHLLDLLLKDPRVQVSELQEIFICAGQAQSNCLKILIEDPRVDPSANNCEIIDRILENDGGMSYIDIVLKKIKIDIYTIFEKACEYNIADCISELIEEYNVDPSVNDNAALKTVVRKMRIESFRVFMRDERVDPQAVLDIACSLEKNWMSEEILELIDDRIAEKAKDFSKYCDKQYF